MSTTAPGNRRSDVMDIQSIYSGAKTNPAAAASQDEDQAPASGFAALLDMVGSQFKGAFGLGAMDPAVLKKDVDAEAVRAPEPREAKQRPERSDDKDAKAKPAKDDADEGDDQTEETAAADDKSSDAAGAEAQTGAQQAVQAEVAATVDPTLVAQAAAVTTVTVTETVAAATTETVVAETEVAATAVVAAEAEARTAETVVDPKAVQQTEVKAAEKVVAPEAVVKETARTQQTTSASTAAQDTQNTETAQVETETAAVETKNTAKDAAARTDTVRSAAAQDQASNLARLLGTENRVQVQVHVNAAHAAKQSMPDVSIYNIYSGYSAADAISLANGQFGQADETNALTQSAPAARPEGPAQAAVVAQAAQQVSGANSNGQTNAPARAEGAPMAIQASASSNGASNANMGFSAFTQSGQSSAQTTQQAAHANPTDRPAATAQQVIDQIKVNITKAAKAGLDRVTINLKPVELGRIEIKLEMSEDHKVRVTVTADNKDTLNLLQTDSRTLERTLNDAGLRTDANNLSFNLRSETDAGAADGQRGNGGNKTNGNAHAETANDNADQNFDYAAAAFARGGVDTFA
ncbi:MAG: flagellar hook-length control protein FliK [Rhodospirillaceae bacterium]